MVDLDSLGFVQSIDIEHVQLPVELSVELRGINYFS